MAERELTEQVLEVSEDRPPRKRTQALKSTERFLALALARARARALNPNPSTNDSDTLPQYHADDPSRGANGAAAASYLFS